jgi:uncharacterized membrane protein
MPKMAIYGTAAMLLLGVLPLPYGYYMLLRIVACGAFAYACFIAYRNQANALPWVYGLFAVVFNPIAPIRLDKGTWVLVDILAGATLLLTAKSITAREE